MSRVGFSGTRRGMTAAQEASVDGLLESLIATDVLHGDCVGADDQLDALAVARGLFRLIYPAEAPVALRADCCGHRSPGSCCVFPRRPALERDRVIAAACEMLIAAPFEETEQRLSGTWATLRYARRLGRPLYLVGRDGGVRQEGRRADVS